MPISLQCHGCGQRMRVKNSAAGGKVTCPACKYVTDIPGGDDDDDEADDAYEKQESQPRRKRRKPKRQPRTNPKYFDALGERDDDWAPIRWMTTLFNLNLLAVLLLAWIFFELMLPMALIV